MIDPFAERTERLLASLPAEQRDFVRHKIAVINASASVREELRRESRSWDPPEERKLDS